MKRGVLVCFGLGLGLVASCRTTPAAAPATAATVPPELEVKLAALEQRIDMLEKLLAGQAGSDGEPLPADSAARVSRVEARLDKVIGFLKQAVRPELDTSLMYALPVDPNDPVVGSADAAVTLVEAYEYLCPYCNLLEPTIERLQREYPKQLRVVSKYLVIHGPPAVPGGIAACAVGRQGKYGAFGPAMWKAIWSDEDGAPVRDEGSADAVAARAKAAGVDPKRYQADVAPDGVCEQWLQRTADTLERFGVSGTPTVFINGRMIENRDYNALKLVIDAELAAVKTSGVAPGKYYSDVVMARGKSEAVMISPFD